MFTHQPDPVLDDLSLLRIGRHFRFSPSCKIIVGRNKAENERIWPLSAKGCLLKVEGHGSPTALVVGEVTDETLMVAASLCARYFDAKRLSEVEVTAYKENDKSTFRVSPADDEIVEVLRIELKSAKHEITVPNGCKAIV